MLAEQRQSLIWRTSVSKPTLKPTPEKPTLSFAERARLPVYPYRCSMNLRDPYGTKHPCRECEHFGGDMPGTSHADCLRGNEIRVQADGKRGCVFWVRATGSDDEPNKEK